MQHGIGSVLSKIRVRIVFDIGQAEAPASSCYLGILLRAVGYNGQSMVDARLGTTGSTRYRGEPGRRLEKLDRMAGPDGAGPETQNIRCCGRRAVRVWRTAERNCCCKR